MTIILLCVLVYAAMGMYFHMVLKTDSVYPHFVYVPIVLAGMWWGRKAVIVACILGAVVWTFHLFGIGVGKLWCDIARTVFFVIVAFCVGVLREWVQAGHDALSLSEKRYKQLVEGSLSGICVYRDSTILFANTPLERMLSYDAETLAGMAIFSIICEEDRPKLGEVAARRTPGQPDTAPHELRLLKQDGSPLWANVSASETAYEGRPATLLHAYDITDRRRAEDEQHELESLVRKQEEELVHSNRLAELGVMAAAIAHELNQPLAGIKSFARDVAYMIENNAGSPEEMDENVQLISDQVDRASRIINQMRTITRRSDRTFESVAMNDLVQETVDFLTPQFKLTAIGVRLDLADGLPEVRGDRVRLGQVLLNLLTNARQAMTDSAVRELTVKTYLDAGSTCPVVVEIRDTGPGFTREKAKDLFQPFFTTKKREDGTGLGLPISLRIAEEHAGTIAAVGEPGKGATFSLRLPAQDAPEAPEEGEAHKPEPSRRSRDVQAAEATERPAHGRPQESTGKTHE